MRFSLKAIHVQARSLFTPTKSTAMPLVVPGLMSSGSGNKSDNWASQLMGKKIGDTSDNMTFAKTDLPKEHRVVKEGDMMTMDHKPERLNIHVGEDGIVKKVAHG